MKNRWKKYLLLFHTVYCTSIVIFVCEPSTASFTQRGPYSTLLPIPKCAGPSTLSRVQAKTRKQATQELAAATGPRIMGPASPRTKGFPVICEYYRKQINECAIAGRKASVLTHLRAAYHASFPLISSKSQYYSQAYFQHCTAPLWHFGTESPAFTL